MTGRGGGSRAAAWSDLYEECRPFREACEASPACSPCTDVVAEVFRSNGCTRSNHRCASMQRKNLRDALTHSLTCAGYSAPYCCAHEEDLTSRHCLSNKLHIQSLECQIKLDSHGECSILSCKGGTLHRLVWGTARIVLGTALTLCSGVLFILWRGFIVVVVRTIRGAAPECGGTCRLLWGCFISAAAKVGFVVGLAGMLVFLASVMRAVRAVARLGA